MIQARKRRFAVRKDVLQAGEFLTSVRCHFCLEYGVSTKGRAASKQVGRPYSTGTRQYGGLKDSDRIFTNLYNDESPYLDGALKRVRKSVLYESECSLARSGLLEEITVPFPGKPILLVISRVNHCLGRCHPVIMVLRIVVNELTDEMLCNNDVVGIKMRFTCICMCRAIGTVRRICCPREQTGL